LSKNAVERPDFHVIARVPGHRDTPSLGRMLVLPMAAALAN
jgi:hypothetical protein